MAENKVARGLAKGVGIDVDYRKRNEPSEFVRNAASNIRGVEPYYEEEPTVGAYLWSIRPTGPGVVRYFRGLFPFLNWIFHYNLTWLLGDIVAGKL